MPPASSYQSSVALDFGDEQHPQALAQAYTQVEGGKDELKIALE